jgi:hypothetical protein
MNIKTKIAVTTAGLLALGGSAFGISLGSGVASATPTTGATSPSTKVAQPDLTLPGDPGPAIQSGQQSGADSAAPDIADTTPTEANASEKGAASDGPGGHQDPGGNVDHQSTTEQ